MGVLAAGGRLGAMSAQFVNGSLEQNIPLLLFVTSACTVVGGLAAWLLPNDTAGQALTEGTESPESVARKTSAGVNTTRPESVFSPLPSAQY